MRFCILTLQFRMRIIDKYIIKKFLGTFFYAISLLIMIVIVFDVAENMDRFIKNDAPLNGIIFDYYLNFIPYFINLFIFLFTFISVIFFTSKLAGDTEIVAILSSGISFRRLLLPYLMASLVLALLSFYLGNFLIPKTNETRRVFKDAYMFQLAEDRARDVHIQIEPMKFAYVESFSSKLNSGYKFALEKYDSEKLVYKLMADRITWDTVDMKWTLKNYYFRTIDSTGQRIYTGKEMDTTINHLHPTDLYVINEFYEEMNYFELNDYIEKEKRKGSIAYKRYENEKHKRLAGPAAIIILTFIGVALSSRKVRGGIGMHLGIGISLTFSYIFLMQVSTVFSTFGNLHPAIGAWIPNFIFFFIGLYLLQKAPK